MHITKKENMYDSQTNVKLSLVSPKNEVFEYEFWTS